MRKLFLLGLVVVAAGCGGGSDGSGDGVGNDEPFKPASGADYEVFASEFSFAPPFLVLDKPGTYTFAVRNDGSVPHNFTIKGVGGTEDAQPGETTTAELTLKKAGTYEIICTVPGHEAQGMYGTLNVTAG